MVPGDKFAKEEKYKKWHFRKVEFLGHIKENV